MHKALIYVCAVLGAGALAGVGFWLGSQQPDQVSGLQTEVEELKGRLNRLQEQDSAVVKVPQAPVTERPLNPVARHDSADIEALQRDVAELKAAQVPEAQSPPGDLPVSPEEIARENEQRIEEQQRAQEEQQRAQQERLVQLEEAFQLQDLGDEWAGDTSQLLQREVEVAMNLQPEWGAVLHQIECKNTLCKVDIENTDLMKASRTEIEIAMRTNQEFAGSIATRKIGADGRVRSTIYLVKKGEQMPL